MALTYLVTAAPIDPSTRLPVAIRMAGGGVRPYTHLGFGDWRAGAVRLPLFTASIGFDQNGWTGGSVPTTGDLQFSPSGKEALSELSRLFFLDTPISILIGDDEAAAPQFLPYLKAKVSKQAVDSGTLTLTISDLSGDLTKPISPDRFAGTGGIEGDIGVEGRSKRRSFGRVFNVEGRVLIAVDNIYEFGDPARPFKQFDAVRDKGRAAPSEMVTLVAWQGSVAATLATLRAAVAPQGGAAVAPSIACVKWWTQPVGPLTADIRGEGGAAYAETSPGIAAYIVDQMSDLTVAAVDAAIAQRPGVAGIHVEDTSETGATTLDKLLLGVSLIWIVNPAGSISILPLFLPIAADQSKWADQSAQTSAAHGTGGAPATWGKGYGPADTFLTAQVSRREVFRPIKSRRLGYQRNYRQHTDAEISAVLTYGNGDTLDSLKPATAGADKTATSETGLIVADALNEDGTVKDDKVTTTAIAASAVQQTLFARVTADLSIAQNTIATVASLTFTKQESDSDVKVTFSGMFWSADDVQFNCSVLVDGSTSFVAGQQNLIFDGQASAAKATISPFVYLELGVGQHTIGFQVQNVENDNIPLTVKAGSALEVLEIKQGAQ